MSGSSSRSSRGASIGSSLKAGMRGIKALGSGDSVFFDEGANPGMIRRQLDGASITSQAGINERARALKWLLAQTTSGKDVSQYFPDVVKNVIAKDVQVKKLVYMYLTHYADADAETRELALLSINTFQRDMSSPNMLLRSLALRVLCSIRIKDIVTLQMLAASTCARDSSPYVRKTAAHALSKLYRLDPEQKPQIVEILGKLIGDSSTLVFGSALAVFHEICPERLDLLHPHFRKLCERLVDLDRWGQISTINVLLRYGRTQFLNPRTDSVTGELVEAAGAAGAGAGEGRGGAGAGRGGGGGAGSLPSSSGKSTRERHDRATSVEALSGFYSSDEEDGKKKGQKKKKMGGSAKGKAVTPVKNADASAGAASAAGAAGAAAEQKNSGGGSGLSPSGSPAGSDGSSDEPTPAAVHKPKARGVSDTDHQLLLAMSLALLHSQSAGVILAVASLHWYLGSRKDVTLAKIIKALCRALRTSAPEMQHILLDNILKYAGLRPHLFRPYIPDFFVKLSTDRAGVRKKKLDMLTMLASHDNLDKLLAEFTEYVRHPDPLFVSQCVLAVGRGRQCRAVDGMDAHYYVIVCAGEWQISCVCCHRCIRPIEADRIMLFVCTRVRVRVDSGLLRC